MLLFLLFFFPVFILPPDPSQERFLLSFTVRDSPTDFINVTCWGSKEFVTDLSCQFAIGDVGECALSFERMFHCW